MDILEQSQAIQYGHFLLSSGKHSHIYIEKFRILENPLYLEPLCKNIAAHFKDHHIDYVAGPETGGMLVAQVVARLLEKQAFYVPLKSKHLASTTSIVNKHILLVDDVFTTGLSLNESAQCIEQLGGIIVGRACLIQRSPNNDIYAPKVVNFPTYNADNIPEWLAQIPITKPGTRTT